jgi:hypothetical protein
MKLALGLGSQIKTISIINAINPKSALGCQVPVLQEKLFVFSA